MKVYLIHLPSPELLDDQAFEPLGLCFLYAHLERNGVDVHMVDLAGKTEDEWDLPTDGDVYGVSVVTAQHQLACRVAELLKSDANLLVIGGIHATAIPDIVLRSSRFDVAVCGEGEHTLLEIVRGVPLYKIAGINFNTPHGRVVTPGRPLENNVDMFPFPRLDIVDRSVRNTRIFYTEQAEGFWKEPGYRILTARGCPFDCAFCGSPVMWNRRLRRHTIKYVDKWIRYLREHGYRNFHLLDEEIALDDKRLGEICAMLKKYGGLWRCSARADDLDRSTLQLMYDSGCRQIEVGIESGSQRVLDLMGKRTPIETMHRIVDDMYEVGIGLKGAFIIGFPGETEADRELTFEFIKKHKDKMTVNLNTFLCLPGCAVWNNPEKYGVTNTSFRKPENFKYFWDSTNDGGCDICITPEDRQAVDDFMNTLRAEAGDRLLTKQIRKRDEV